MLVWGVLSKCLWIVWHIRLSSCCQGITRIICLYWRFKYTNWHFIITILFKKINDLALMLVVIKLKDTFVTTVPNFWERFFFAKNLDNASNKIAKSEVWKGNSLCLPKKILQVWNLIGSFLPPKLAYGYQIMWLNMSLNALIVNCDKNNVRLQINWHDCVFKYLVVVDNYLQFTDVDPCPSCE